MRRAPADVDDAVHINGPAGRGGGTRLGMAVGAAAWLAVAPLLRRWGAAVTPDVSTDVLVETLTIALLANGGAVAVCFELARRARPWNGRALHYGVGFASVHLVLDAAFLFVAFRSRWWAQGLSSAQLEAIAAFLPLAYLEMIWIPLALDASRRP